MNRPTKPKGVTTQMKALDEYFLMAGFTLLLNRVHDFAILMFIIWTNMAVKGLTQSMSCFLHQNNIKIQENELSSVITQTSVPLETYFPRLLIWVVTPLGFVSQIRIWKFSPFIQISLWQWQDQGPSQFNEFCRKHIYIYINNLQFDYRSLTHCP